MKTHRFAGAALLYALLVGGAVVFAGCSPEPAPTEPGAAIDVELGRAHGNVGAPVDLGTFGGSFSIALGINARGQVVGGNSVQSDYPYKALMWFRGAVTDLVDFGGEATAWAVNDRGQVVGGGGPSGFLWERGKVTDLGAFFPRDINNRSEMVGSITTGNGWVHVGFWRQGKVTDLGTLRGPDAPSYAVGINNRGQVVGEGPAPGQPDGDYHAILWERGATRDLGAWRPTGINDRGQIVGLKWIDAFTNHVVVWEGGTLTDLGLERFYPNGIGDHGEIVGAVEDQTGQWHGVVWHKGIFTYLPTLGGGRSEAFAINARGQVVGTAENAVGETHAVLWELRRN